MTNLSRNDRTQITDLIQFQTGTVLRSADASDGTRKLLMNWTKPANNNTVSSNNDTLLSHDKSLALPVTNTSSYQTECVMIPAGENENRKPRKTACLSSQAGCPVGCKFCASGIGGLESNLTTGQILEQVWHLNHALTQQNKNDNNRITNIVFMGMGEPMSNYNAVVQAVRTLNAPWAFNISARKITISTVGIPSGIRRLATENLPVTLALSLHAPNDEIRKSLIPWAHFVSIAELMDACREYFRSTGREITFEYTLIRDINDQPEHARELATLVKTVRGNVNLIRYNEVADLPYQRPRGDDIHEFQGILRAQKVNAHIRASRGRDIAAACGQLRHEQQQQQT